MNDWTYDNLGRTATLKQQGQQGGNAVAVKNVGFAFDLLGQPSSVTRYADLAATQLVAQSDYTFDQAGRLTDLTHAKGQTTLADYSWTFDAQGRITQYVNSIDGTSDYSYDATGQLTAADHDYQDDEEYSYDASGNRTMTGYQTGDNNRLESDGTYTYGYDAEGNRTVRTSIATGETTRYAWDHRNRLIRVTAHADPDPETPSSKTVEYTYDYQNRWIKKSVDADGDGQQQSLAATDQFFYDLNQVALRFNGDGDLVNRYLWGPAVDQVLADEQVDSLLTPGAILWPLTDHLNTIRDLATYDDQTDTTTVANHVTYDSFGNVTAETNAAVDEFFGYTGRAWEHDAQIQYNSTRWYEATTARWLSEDVVQFAAGGNLYAYVKNDPICANDPLGLSETRQGHFLQKPQFLLPPDEATTAYLLKKGLDDIVQNYPRAEWPHKVDSLLDQIKRTGLPLDSKIAFALRLWAHDSADGPGSDILSQLDQMRSQVDPFADPFAFALAQADAGPPEFVEVPLPYYKFPGYGAGGCPALQFGVWPREKQVWFRNAFATAWAEQLEVSAKRNHIPVALLLNVLMAELIDFSFWGDYMPFGKSSGPGQLTEGMIEYYGLTKDPAAQTQPWWSARNSIEMTAQRIDRQLVELNVALTGGGPANVPALSNVRALADVPEMNRDFVPHFVGRGPDLAWNTKTNEWDRAARQKDPARAYDALCPVPPVADPAYARRKQAAILTGILQWMNDICPGAVGSKEPRVYEWAIDSTRNPAITVYTLIMNRVWDY